MPIPIPCISPCIMASLPLIWNNSSKWKCVLFCKTILNKRNPNKKKNKRCGNCNHLFFFAEKSSNAAFNALFLLRSCNGGSSCWTHASLHVMQLRAGEVSDGYPYVVTVLVKTVLAAVTRRQGRRRSPRIECAVVMMPMPAAWSANLVSISTTIFLLSIELSFDFFHLSSIFLQFNLFAKL